MSDCAADDIGLFAYIRINNLVRDIMLVVRRKIRLRKVFWDILLNN